MPRGRPENQDSISKMEAMRRTLAALGNDSPPKAIHKHLKSEFGIAMNPGMLSNYKSVIRSEGNKGAVNHPPAATKSTEGFSLADIQAVKEVADKIGEDKVRQLVKVIAK